MTELTNNSTLKKLGFHPNLETYRKEQKWEALEVGRVISEHKGRYQVKTVNGEVEATLLGKLIFVAKNRLDFPAVGDWVAINVYDEDKALIHAIYPRQSIVVREYTKQRMGGEKQVIGTNIDYGFIIQAVDRDYNLNRIERYLTICNAANIPSIIILNKIDLIDEEQLQAIVTELRERVKEEPIVCISNETQAGIEELRTYMQEGKTYCLLGSSGVGKSTLTNSLMGKAVMSTGAINAYLSRGKHVTSHRELHVLESGGIIIDNPGMRMVGIADAESGLESTFDQITALTKQCKFNDCTHIHEVGCAIIHAIIEDELDLDAYENFLKLEREAVRFKRKALKNLKKANGKGGRKYNKNDRKKNKSMSKNYYK